MNLSRMKSACSVLVLSALALGVPAAALAESSAVAVATPPAAVPAAPPATAVSPEAAAPQAAPTSARTEQDLVVRGIYLQQLTAQNPKRLKRLIERSLKAGINTFVVDVWSKTPGYARAIQTIQEAGIQYVPRVTMFPDGARGGQHTDKLLLAHRMGLVEYAISLGAKDVQLDYIRFSSQNADSPENAKKILEVIRSFRERIEQKGARLQIDVFGEVAYGPSTHIGQDMQRFAPALHAVCPMLYPSHFEPHEQTAKDPYGTVHGALLALDRQIEQSPIPVYAYIEPFNYRHKMSDAERATYFEAQVQAVLDSKAQGFYVWSAGNYYDIVFNVLNRRAAERERAAAPDKAVASADLPAAATPGRLARSPRID
jgi:hypothetical protein